MSIFEFDSSKSEPNKSKHGIDFGEAQLTWNYPNFLEVQAKSDDEPRFLIIGKVFNKCWSAVITYHNE